jgi:hypothetical protein
MQDRRNSVGTLWRSTVAGARATSETRYCIPILMRLSLSKPEYSPHNPTMAQLSIQSLLLAGTCILSPALAINQQLIGTWSTKSAKVITGPVRFYSWNRRLALAKMAFDEQKC